MVYKYISIYVVQYLHNAELLAVSPLHMPHMLMLAICTGAIYHHHSKTRSIGIILPRLLHTL